MEKKAKKICANILMIISIINIINAIIGYFSALVGNHSFNVSLSASTQGIIICTIIVVLLQIFNILLSKILLKKDLTNKKQILIIFLEFVIIVITFFIPIKRTHSLRYTYPTNNKTNGIMTPSSMGATTHIISYENLYGYTLKKDESTSLGMDIY